MQILNPSYTRSHFPGNRAAILRQLSFVAISLAIVGQAVGQSANPAPASNNEETITLSPFVVTTGDDVGFAASSSMAGGRIATPLKDTPVAYSVITAEFIEAFNLTDVIEAAAFTTNSARDNQDNTYKAFGTTSASWMCPSISIANRDTAARFGSVIANRPSRVRFSVLWK